MCEKIIDKLYVPSRHGVKPRTYRRLARKKFLATAKKKTKSSQEIYKANGQQLRFLRRNLAHIDRLLETYSPCPLSPKELGYLRVIHTVYEQQRTLFKTRSRRIDNRIVNLHQPHVRPIVRGKERSRVEFGSKLQVSLVEGFMFIDKIGWEAYNEGQHLKSSVAQYKARWGYYPECVYADRIYCTRENRRWLAEQGIKLSAKPLGRPSRSAVAHHVRPQDRNPIEGKFGQAKIAFGMDKIRAKLKETSESWIASIALVLNLLNLRRRARLPVQIALEELCRWLEESSGSNRRLMQTIGFGRLHAVHSSYLAWKGQKISILPEYQSSKRPYKIPKSKTGVNTSVFRPLCPINDNYFELRAAS